jgi:hypothetical protein
LILASQLSQGSSHLGETLDETTIVTSQTDEIPDIGGGLWPFPCHYRLNLTGINGYALFRDDMPQEPHFFQPKLTL